MTAAVCLECGHMKTGAWKRCPGCRHLPKSLEDRARHLITTDHYLSHEKLEAVSQQIQAGQAPQFVDTQVQAVMQQLQSIENDPREIKRRRWLKLKVHLILLTLGGLIITAVWLWLSSR
ncbi:hypothetical protein EI77_01978 [Prosthecobacter fusiformis]|uniref:Uncharacterized protein n=1 Tax=Prosthecobacter fusiformis TaxID=48464 RepID=A0A4R7RY64_9BACT|nr:hypothetical protein [Prosthecobacter fusiformis]TDU70860.1 hypothetical protein EI77_01978 [Prosthecobacter fusiformis]